MPGIILIPLVGFVLILVSCGKGRTEKLLVDKQWRVTNVTPPANGNFDIEDENEAQQLKNSVYQNAWFEFTHYGIFMASFNGKLDSGDYKLNYNGKIISLYPLHGNRIYEQIQIQRLNSKELNFNTLIAHFYMTLHCKAH
ncbi:MAG TPA: hypothetical protein VNE41_04440 [Chitinophagaceae bacterium]|nr:hypothetical protein [Chitinophagaceae bacterium]